MKLHAAIGADLLSALNFPTPSCRSFDITTKTGMGRVTRTVWWRRRSQLRPEFWQSWTVLTLSLLTAHIARSQRRDRRPDLRDRRGTMYDPLVVDKFLEVHRDLTPNEPQITAEQRQFIAHIAEVNQPESQSAATQYSITSDEAQRDEFDQASVYHADRLRPLVGSFGVNDLRLRATHTTRFV